MGHTWSYVVAFPVRHVDAVLTRLAGLLEAREVLLGHLP